MLPGQHGGQCRLRIRAQLGDHAGLDFALQPTVAAAGRHHRTTTELTLDPTSHLRWREELILEGELLATGG